MGRVEMEALYPRTPGETPEVWTGRVLSHSREHKVNRQCSIGYHEECSDPQGFDCQCLCHTDAVVFTVEGHPKGEGQVISRSEVGKLNWPPVKGEPEGTWAHWVLAFSPKDAESRAIAKQKLLI